MTDFSTPRRMSVGAFVIMFIKSLREYTGVLLIAIPPALFGTDNTKSPLEIIILIAVIIGGVIVLSLLTAFMRYYFRKFHIEDHKLIFAHGIVTRMTTSIPLSRVHTLRTRRGLFYRLLDMRGVAFDTLASDRQEVELILNEHDWLMLLQRVGSSEYVAPSHYAPIPPPLPDEQSTLSASNLQTIIGALCQNQLKGFAVLGGIMVTVLDNLSQIDNEATDRVIGYLDAYTTDVAVTQWHWDWLWYLAALYVILMVLWTGKTAVRHGNMSLLIDGRRMTIESGLISRYTSRVARNKVTVLSIKQNPLEKMAGCRTVTLRQASNASDNKKQGDIRIYGSNLGSELKKWWLGDKDGSGDTPLLDVHSGSGVFARRFIPHLIIALTAAVAIIHSTQVVLPTVVFSIVYLAITAISAFMAWRHSSVQLTDSCVTINSGNIATISEYIRYHDIETVGIRNTPFTAYTGRVTLRISTNAGAVAVPSLPKIAAFALRHQILNRIMA